jgi:hypothetical protein
MANPLLDSMTNNYDRLCCRLIDLINVIGVKGLLMGSAFDDLKLIFDTLSWKPVDETQEC